MKLKIFTIILIIQYYFTTTGHSLDFGRNQFRRQKMNCPRLKFLNGRMSSYQNGKRIDFNCDRGFIREGDKSAMCSNGRWNVNQFPICTKPGCLNNFTQPENGRISLRSSKTEALLFCEPNFEIIGSPNAYCINGTHWDRNIGTCRETDNAVQTFCDFESASICGWIHDSDHDTDFERQNGYDNKTITVNTGPQADHTTGIPLQGYYMVINTNSRVSTKKARLISPLYNFANATKLCFKFYYLMHGAAVGTLRVYMKPESVELYEILEDTMEIGKNNTNIIFEKKGSIVKDWMEGVADMKPINESFQIIIEAISGQTRMSDIAFDDVSIQSDDDCSPDDDEDDDESVTKAPGDVGILSVDSCVNRCFESVNITVEMRSNHSLKCSCSANCVPDVTCCPDFLDVCYRSLTTEIENLTYPTTTTTLMENKTIQTLSTTMRTVTPEKAQTTTLQTSTTTSKNILTSTSTTSSATKTTTSTVKKTTTTSRTSTNPTSTMTIKSSTLTPQASTKTFLKTTKITVGTSTPKTATTKVNQTTKSSDYKEVEMEDEHDIADSDVDEISSFVTMATPHRQTESENESEFPFKALLIGILVIVFISFIAVVGYRRYLEASNPLNYKERHENNCSKNANEEFSEIRFLTSDETLDFTLVTENDLL